MLPRLYYAASRAFQAVTEEFHKLTSATTRYPAWTRWLLPSGVFFALFALWYFVARSHRFPDYCLPSPSSVLASFQEEIAKHRLGDDIVASLFRVGIGLALAIGLGIPIGLAFGQTMGMRLAFLPLINFLRNLSPLAWIPFAILWFGVGDEPAIYLIFMATFPPMVLTTMAAVSTIPEVRFRVARDYGFRGVELLTRVTLPAIMPQVVTAIRVTAGIAWVVVVAAEMAGVQNGLGYAISDARSGLRSDTVVAYMIVIGVLGIGIDRLLSQLTKMPNVRWGYEH